MAAPAASSPPAAAAAAALPQPPLPLLLLHALLLEVCSGAKGAGGVLGGGGGAGRSGGAIQHRLLPLPAARLPRLPRQLPLLLLRLEPVPRLPAPPRGRLRQLGARRGRPPAPASRAVPLRPCSSSSCSCACLRSVNSCSMVPSRRSAMLSGCCGCAARLEGPARRQTRQPRATPWRHIAASESCRASSTTTSAA